MLGLRVPPSGRVFHATSGVAIDLLKESCGCKGCFICCGFVLCFDHVFHLR